MKIEYYDVIIIGSGLSGSVLAHLFATELNKKVLVLEKRNHIGGNCYDFINEFGFLEHRYGAHLFHTNSEKIWNFVQQFDEWIPYHHKVYASINNLLVPIPINISSINLLFNLNIEHENEMKKWLKDEIEYSKEIKNGKDVILQKFGTRLYDIIFKHYTKKQWDKYPDELDSSILERIPIRYNFDEGYFNDKYQYLPKHGYTFMINNMLDHNNITVKLNIEFDPKKFNKDKNQILIYTGPIDHYFKCLNLPSLEYRSLNFERNILSNLDFYQSNSVINYPQSDIMYTRIVEPKHFYKELNKNILGTVIIKEYSTSKGEPYYPVLNSKNIEIYQQYQNLTKNLEKDNIYFLGRLANFKYFNMDEAILNSISFYENYLKKKN